jgi:hypothetical protein
MLSRILGQVDRVTKFPSLPLFSPKTVRPDRPKVRVRAHTFSDWRIRMHGRVYVEGREKGAPTTARTHTRARTQVNVRTGAKKASSLAVGLNLNFFRRRFRPHTAYRARLSYHFAAETLQGDRDEFSVDDTRPYSVGPGIACTRLMYSCNMFSAFKRYSTVLIFFFMASLFLGCCVHCLVILPFPFSFALSTRASCGFALKSF